MSNNNAPGMTVEELMKPRFKVIALWPNTEYKVGDILTPEYHIEKTIKWCESFPHLFKRLEWYEERKPEEMPEYYKYSGNHGIFKTKSRSHEEVVMLDFSPTETVPVRLEFTLPATLAEYQQYINSKQQP